MSILIKNITVLTGGEILRDVNIFVNNKKFEYIGKNSDFKADRVIDGNGKIIMPGLINTHTHIAMTFLRGYADGVELSEWLFEKIFPTEDKMTGEDAYWSSQLGMLEMVSSGTTAFNDMYMFVDKIADAVIESGMRAKIGRGLQCFENGDFTCDARLKECMDFYKNYTGKGDGRITAAFGMHSVYCCTDEYLEYCAKQSVQTGGFNHIHLSETADENKNCIDRYGKTPTRLMYDAGVFDADCVAAHGVHLSDDDISLICEKNVSIAVNPASNLKLNSGIAQPARLMEKGVNVCLGTDGASSNNNVDMMREMHLAGLLYNMGAKETFNVATKNGAKALGYKDAGEIKEGFLADFVILNTDAPHFHPMHDIYANLIYSAKTSDVEMTVVNGKILYEKGEFLTLDAEKIKYEVNKIKERIC